MKTLLFIFLLESFLFSGVRIGTDISGEHKMTNFTLNDESLSSADFDVENGFSASFESPPDFSKVFSWGFGTEYMLGREIEDVEGDFHFTSIYLIVYNTIKKNEPLFFSARLGYGRFEGDKTYEGSGLTNLQGGLFYGYGAGYKLNEKLLIEGIFCHNYGQYFSSDLIDYSFYTFEYDLEYTRFNISLNYLY